jgi:3-deoxy-manno-octulosonate cytidylyltransferase (CMP-KDO synthetase)
MRVITKEEEYLNQNVVKVVFDMKDNALYFSREPLPSGKMTTAPFDKYKQLGVIAFRKEFLLKFTQFEPTPLEVIESNDMLRIIENGYTVRMVKSEFPLVGVDTHADIEKVKEIMETDPLFPLYYT